MRRGGGSPLVTPLAIHSLRHTPQDPLNLFSHGLLTGWNQACISLVVPSELTKRRHPVTDPDFCPLCNLHYAACFCAHTLADQPMDLPTCDNDCTRMGWHEYILEQGCTTLHVSVHPDTDLDDHFRAFCHDEQEMIRVKGWLIEGSERLN